MPRSTRSSSGSPVSASGSSLHRTPRRSSSATVTPSSSPRSRSRLVARPLRAEIRHLARTEVREVEEPFGRRPEGLLGDAAQAQSDHRRADLRPGAHRPGDARSAWRTSPSGTSATSRTRPPSVSSSPMLPRRSTTCSTASRGSSTASSSTRSACARTSMRATVSTSASGCCSRSSSAVWSATTAYRASSAWRWTRGTGAWTSGSSSAADARSPARVDLARSSPSSAYTRHVDAVFDRLGLLSKEPIACLTAPVASGKVRELYTLDGDRLLLVASDRLSTYDVVLPTEIPDKGRVLDRSLGVLVHPDGGTSSRTTCRPPLRRPFPRVSPAEMLPLEFVVRGFLAGSGWVDYQATGAVCGPPLPQGLRESERLPEPIVTPATKASEGHDQNIDERRRGRSAVGVDYAAGARPRSSSTRLRPSTRRRAGSSSQTRSSSSVSTATGASRSADEALTPDSSRFWPLEEYTPGRPQPSFDKQFVRDYCAEPGWDKRRRGPELPADVVAGTRARYVEAFERLTGLPSTTTSPTRRGCSGEGDGADPPESGDPRPTGRGRADSLRHARVRGVAARGSAGWSSSRSTQTTPPPPAPRSSGCATSSSRTR